MKKKISSLIISFAMILSCLFMFTSCGKKKDPTPPAVTVTGVSVELVTEDYEMTDDTITFDYGVKVELEVSDFKVTAQKSDNTSVEISQKTETVDGFTFASTVPADDVTPAGEYKLTFSYAEKQAEVKVKVNQGTIDMTGVSWTEEAEFTYDGHEKFVVLQNIPEGVMVSYENNEATDAGNYTAVATFVSADENYANPEVMTKPWVINKADLDMSNVYITTGFSYDGTVKEARLVLSSLPAGVSATPVVENANKKTNAGSHQVEYSFTLSEDLAKNYNAISNKTYTFVINKGNISADQVIFNKTFIYNGDAQAPTVDDFNFPAGVSASAIEVTAQENAGKYSATLTLAYEASALENYNNVTTLVVEWSINKNTFNTSTVAWSATKTFTYDGTPKSVTISGLPEGLEVSGYTNNTQTNAGSYTASAQFAYDTTNFEAPALSVSTCVWIINKAELTVTANNNTITFNDDPAYNGITITGFVAGESEATVDPIAGKTILWTTYSKGKNVGTYTIYASDSGFRYQNYNVNYVTGTLTVNPLSVSVKDVSFKNVDFTYNGQVQKIELQGVPTGVKVAYEHKLNNTTIVASPIGAGTYTTTVTLTPKNGNYVLIDTDINLQRATWVIKQAELTVKANDKETIFMQEAPAYDYVISGFVNGENETVIKGTAVFATTYVVGSDATTYDITLASSTLESRNYTFKYVKGTLTVNKATFDLANASWVSESPYTYNGKHQAPTIVGIPTWVDSSVSYQKATETVDETINVGEYVAIANVPSTANYDVTGTLENCEYVISAAKLTVAANNKEIKYYESAPAYDYEIVGFVNNETDSVVSGSVVFGCEYEVSDVVATYPITKTSGELSATNYVFEYKGAELIVSKATVDVSGVTWQYIDTYTYNGLTQSPTISEIVALFEVNYNYLYNNDPDLEPINAGSYEVKVVFEENANYNISGTISKRQFIINKATVDETRICWNVGEEEECIGYYIKGYEHEIEFYNNSGVELEITWISEDPTKNGPTEIGTYNYELKVAVVDAVNYNTLTKTTYKLKYIIKDVVKSVSATVYESGKGDKAAAKTVVYDGTAFVFENVVVTDIAVTFEDELPLNYAFYTSRALTTEVDIQDISSFEKGVIYYAIYVPTNPGEYEIFDVRAINVQASYDIKLKVSDEVSTTYTLGVDTEAESVSLEPATYQILLNAYANENVAATVYNMPSYSAEYRADAIELSNEIVSVVVKIEFVIQETTYYFEKQLTLVPSVDSDDYFTASFTVTPDDGEAETITATNNTLDVGADVTNINNLSADSIDVDLNEDIAETHEISSKEIVSYGGSYFLRVELAEKNSEAFAASAVKLYSTNEPVVVYIKLLVNGTFDSNTDAVISCEGSTVDYIHNQIVMYVDQRLVVETNNEFARIELHADGQSQANIVEYGRLEYIFEETWTFSGCSLAIKATDGTYEYWTVIVKEREPASKNIIVYGVDMFENPLNDDGSKFEEGFSTYAGLELGVTKTESGEYIDSLNLTNWSSSKAFVIMPISIDQYADEVVDIKLYEIVADAEPLFIKACTYDKIMGNYYLNMNFQKGGQYLAEVIYDNGLATEILITVSGKFGPFISTTYGDTTLSQTFDDNGEAKGDFVFFEKFEDMMGDDEISYYEGYLGEVEGVGDTLEITINADYSNDLYYSDGETKIDGISNPVELAVQTSEDGFKFVEFILKQTVTGVEYTENGPEEYEYEKILKIQLYLCDKAERVYYHSFTFGDNTEEYDFRVSFDRLYDFGNVNFEIMMGGCYIELSREELDMAQNATTATLNITLSKTYEDYSYLFVTQEGAYGFGEIENPSAEDIETFISQGLIFKADAEGKLSVPVEFVDGMSIIYVTVEGFDGTSFDEYSAVPLYIFIEGEFDWDQGGSGGDDGYIDYSVMPDGINFTISFKGTDYVKEDFEFRSDIGCFVVDTNTTLADIVNNYQIPCEFTGFVYDDMTYSKVEIFSTQVNSEQFPAIYNMYIHPHQTDQYNYGYCGMVNITLYKDGEYYRSVQLLFTFSDSLTWNGNPGSGGGPSGPGGDSSLPEILEGVVVENNIFASEGGKSSCVRDYKYHDNLQMYVGVAENLRFEDMSILCDETSQMNYLNSPSWIGVYMNDHPLYKSCRILDLNYSETNRYYIENVEGYGECAIIIIEFYGYDDKVAREITLATAFDTKTTEEPEVPTEYLPAGVNISVVIGQETLNDFDRHLTEGGFYALSTQNLADLAQNEGKSVVVDSISVDIELAEYDSFKLYDANGNELESTNVNLSVYPFEEGYCPEFRIRLYYNGNEECDREIRLAIAFADSWELLNPEQ